MQPDIKQKRAVGVQPREMQRILRGPAATERIVNTVNVRVTLPTFFLSAGGVVAEWKTFLVVKKVMPLSGISSSI